MSLKITILKKTQRVFFNDKKWLKSDYFSDCGRNISNMWVLCEYNLTNFTFRCNNILIKHKRCAKKHNFFMIGGEDMNEKALNITKKALNVIFWVVVIFLMSVWLFDFVQAKFDNKPTFCINRTTHTYSDGKVYECLGLGYKVFRYERTSMSKHMQFSPFFAQLEK